MCLLSALDLHNRVKAIFHLCVGMRVVCVFEVEGEGGGEGVYGGA